MPDAIALIPTRLKTTALGLPSMVGCDLAGTTVLGQTLARVAQVKQIDKIVVLHSQDEDPLALIDTNDLGKSVVGYADERGLTDVYQAYRASARKWSLTAWRGGLGGATCYDELLPAASLFDAMNQFKADSVLIVGADWPIVDPLLCERVLGHHLEHTDDMQLVFTQAPPGLAGVAVGRKLLEQLAKKSASFGHVLAYNPGKPQADPIGRDVCVQIPASVRSCTKRLIYDTPGSVGMINWVASQMGEAFQSAGAEAVVEAVRGIDDETACGFARLPQMITLELTPRRLVDGPITPQHHVQFDRPDMALDLAKRIVAQLGKDSGIAITLGGLGDALLHEQWEDVVIAARDAGVMGIAIETDLLADRAVIERLLDAPIDVVSIRLNADTADTYRNAMDPQDKLDDGFATAVKNLEWLVNERNRRTGAAQSGNDGAGQHAGMPWLVARMVKTPQTLGDMETFFDRWVYYGGHAVIEPATSGCGLMPDQSPVHMAPPNRGACRQISQRMTILSDGRVAQCDQDWLGRACGGDADTTPLMEVWQAMRPSRQAHKTGRWGELALCGNCHEWHRP